MEPIFPNKKAIVRISLNLKNNYEEFQKQKDKKRGIKYRAPTLKIKQMLLMSEIKC